MANSYFGSKRSSGSFQQIINEIPPVKNMVIGFLGNCPLFEYFSGFIDTFGYEISENVILNYWHGQKGISSHMLYNDYGHIWFADFLVELPKILSSSAASKDTFIYVDPPYLLDTRKNKKPVYEFEMLEHNHIRLLQLLQNSPAYIAISCYDNPLYSSMLEGWRKKSWRVGTRSGAAIETLYMNYDTPIDLFTYDFLGENFTDRQRIKRKLERIQKKLYALQPREAQAIIRHLEKTIKI